MDVETARLVLHLITPTEACRIVARSPGGTDLWHADYPLDDELAPLSILAAGGRGEGVFGLYQIRERANGLAIGGIGFFGPPDEHGVVEVGYGVVRPARGRGLASEALGALVQVAREHGAAAIVAETTTGNTASREVLIRSGFHEARRDGDTVVHLLDL